MTELEYLETACNAYALGLRPFPADWATITPTARLTIAKSLHAELAKSPDAAAFRKQNPRLFPIATSIPARQNLPRPTIRNLIYHACPLVANDGWLANVRQLRKRLHVFNGRRVVAISTDGSGRFHSPQLVKQELPSCEFMVLPNCPVLREVVTFLPLLLPVADPDPTQATFYGHTKGNSLGTTGWTDRHLLGSIYWRNAAYHHLLDRVDACMDELTTHAAVGIHKIVWGDRRQPYPSGLVHGRYMLAGTFFWFRHDRVFAPGVNWRYVPADRYGAEAWIAGLFHETEAASVFQLWPENTFPPPDPYDPALYPEPIHD